MTTDERDEHLAELCRAIAGSDAESAMTRDAAMQLLANLGAIDDETRETYVSHLQRMTEADYDW